jgi:thioredoxin 1
MRRNSKSQCRVIVHASLLAIAGAAMIGFSMLATSQEVAETLGENEVAHLEQPSGATVVRPHPGGDSVVKLTDANFVERLMRSRQPVLVDVWASWCGPCRTLAPVIDQLASEFSSRATVAKLEVDANPRLAQILNVEALPTLLIIKDGSIVDAMVGLVSKSEISERLRAQIDGNNS